MLPLGWFAWATVRPPGLGCHAEQLWRDEQLCGGLLQLLLPGVPALAVGLQLPPERCNSECTWTTAAHLAAFVSAAPVPVLQRALAGQPEAAPRLLSAAAQLLQQCPLPAPSAADLAAPARKGAETTAFIVCLLEAAAALQPSCGSAPSGLMPQLQLRQPLQHLRQLKPCVH